MSVRRDLLEHELRRLGFRGAGGSTSTHASGTSQQQQQAQPRDSEHPQAGEPESGEHSE